jgi:hypothetical protein
MTRMDLLAEYEEMKQIPLHTGITYKFFSMFKVDGDTLYWGVAPAPLEEEVRGPIKACLKAQRAALREGSLTKSECSRRLWFWGQKVLEMGLFRDEIRAEIIKWTEICELVLS